MGVWGGVSIQYADLAAISTNGSEDTVSTDEALWCFNSAIIKSKCTV